MNLQNSFKLVALMLAGVFLAGCVTAKLPESSVDRVARAKELPNAPYERVLIVAIAARGATARAFEEELASELSNKKTYAFGYHRAASRADVREEVVRSIAADNQADAILFVTARLVGAQQVVTEEHVDTQARRMQGGLVDFFSYDYEEYTDPATSDYRVTVMFNSDMFDMETEQRIYTVESRTDLAETSAEVIVAESRELASRLRKDRMVR